MVFDQFLNTYRSTYSLKDHLLERDPDFSNPSRVD